MPRYLLTLILCTFCCFLLCNPVAGLAYNDGATFVKNFSEKNYNAHAQNHGITQDTKGIMFFANNDCILTFDGIQWEGIYMPDIAHVIAVAVNQNGVVFAGGQSQFGYLKNDQNGKYNYVSLLPMVKEDKRNISDVFDVVCLNDMVYFLCEERLFIYNQKEIFTIEPSKNGFFRALFKVNNTIYVNDNNNGLQKLEGTQLKQLKNTTYLGEERVKGMIEMNDKILACTGQNKFIQVEPYSEETEDWFDIPAKNNFKVRTVIKLKNGNICVSSKNDGILIFNTKGEIIAKYNTDNGLVNNSVWFVYEDLQENIWVATDKGISYIEMSSNIKKIKSEYLTEVNLNSVLSYKNDLYIGTSQSIVKVKINNNPFSISKITQDAEPFHHLLIFKDEQEQEQLLASTDHGVVQVINDKLNYIDDDGDFPVKLMSISKFNKNTLLVGGTGKIYVYQYQQKKWLRTATYDIAGYEVISFVEPDSNEIWAGTIGNNFFKIKDGSHENRDYPIEKSKLNLNKKYNTSTLFFYLNGFICVDSDDGIQYFSNNKWHQLGKIDGFPNNTNFKIVNTFESNYNRLWATAVNDADYINCGAFISKNNKLYWEDKYLKRFFNIQINSIFEVNNTLWLASNEGLFFFNLTQVQTGNFNFNTIINAIITPGYIQSFQSNNWNPDKPVVAVPEIQYKYNQMRFDYTASNYVEPEKIMFSSKLIPFDANYSAWTYTRSREFTNLSEGTYTFKVKSMDIYGNIGKEDEFTFTILPPWYRTWWAYTLFAVCAVVVGIALVKFNTRRLKKQNQLLEATVINRTQEIEQQKNKIEEINREVTDSIRYAQMIQNSILPLAADLKNSIPQSFIFYKPRDIVSGDFYWIHEIPEENRIFVAAADCTGHGVPGAFMSMMGMEKLNQSVKVLGKINPSNILSYLNKEIKLTLGKHIKERELRDGMEIALIDVNLKENTINFAGANRPLWLVSPDKDAEDIEVFKPTKAGIAGFTEFNQVFEQNSIKVLPGQTIYLFTDGAIDQFGGPAGKKIMTKGLKKLITEIQAYTLEEQQQLVATFFEEWQAEHEQVDDILIIGIKLEA